MVRLLSPASRPGRRGGQWAGGKEHSYVSESRPTPVCPFSPDVQTAEDGKENSRSESQGDGQEHRQELVDHVFADFKESVAADPHFVKRVCRHGLCNHILESHLRRQDSGILNCRPTCLSRIRESSGWEKQERKTWLRCPTFS